MDRPAVYEVPYNMDDDGPHWNRGDVSEVEGLLAEGRRGDVVELFMRTAGSSEEDIAGAKGSPFWPALEALAHTLAYDAACMGDGPPPTTRLAKIMRPTLVATGGGPPTPTRPDCQPASWIGPRTPSPRASPRRNVGSSKAGDTWSTPTWSLRCSNGSSETDHDGTLVDIHDQTKSLNQQTL